MARTNWSWTSQSSSTAGIAARYVPTNGTAPNIAANATQGQCGSYNIEEKIQIMLGIQTGFRFQRFVDGMFTVTVLKGWLQTNVFSQLS